MDGLFSWIVGLLIIIGILIVFSLPLMWLWNWLMPMIFDLMKINIWQAIGLSFLSKFLFRGWDLNFKN
jgi:hypothetical protein